MLHSSEEEPVGDMCREKIFRTLMMVSLLGMFDKIIAVQLIRCEWSLWEEFCCVKS